MLRDLCKKTGCDPMFWCRLDAGHDGCCVNGISYSREPVRGTAEEARADLVQLRAVIQKACRKLDTERKQSERKLWTSIIRDTSRAIEDRHELILKTQQAPVTQ